jgi:hypothetical protein
MILPFLSQAGTTAANAADMPAVGADTQQANSLAELTRLLGGDLSGSLTGGDKLLALSALMRSATRSGRRAGLTPQQVMGQLQQQKVAEMQNRIKVEEMRAQMAARQQQIADTIEYARTLPEDKQKAFLALPVEKRVDRMETETFRQRQWVGTFVDKEGRTLNRYLDGTTEVAEYSLPPETIIETYDVNGDGVNERVVLDKNTGLPLKKEDGTDMVYPLGMSPAEIAADIDRDLSRAVTIRGQNISAAKGGDGGITGKQTQLRTYKTPSGEVVSGEVRWDRGKDSWVDRAGNKVTLMPSPTAGTNFQIPPQVGERRFQQ